MTRSCARSTALACTVGVLGALPSGADAASAWGPRESVAVDYTTALPGTSAGLRYDVTYHHANNQHPPAVRRVVLIGPPGERIDVGAAPGRCDASDAQIEASGDAACPAAAKVGGGTVVASLLGGPASSEAVSVYATASGFVMLVKQWVGTAVMRSAVHGNVIDTTVPTCLTGGQPSAGCPFDQEFEFASSISLPALGSNGRSLITMPRTCPASGWATTATFYYASAAIEALRTRSHCATQHHRARHGHKHGRRMPSPGHHRRHQRTVTQTRDEAPAAPAVPRGCFRLSALGGVR